MAAEAVREKEMNNNCYSCCVRCLESCWEYCSAYPTGSYYSDDSTDERQRDFETVESENEEESAGVDDLTQDVPQPRGASNFPEGVTSMPCIEVEVHNVTCSKDAPPDEPMQLISVRDSEL